MTIHALGFDKRHSMGIIGWILLGLLAGMIARVMMPLAVYRLVAGRRHS
ncbi:hypothetical protein [Streptomyces sp. NPDC090445]